VHILRAERSVTPTNAAVAVAVFALKSALRRLY
jgi:hypothetical protein